MSDTNSLSSLSPIKSKYVKEEKKWKILSDLNLVQMTGDWASDSKFSAILQDYWEDPFFRFFNKTDPAKLRRTSLICKGYYVRYRVCDYFLRNFLRHASQPVQVQAIVGSNSLVLLFYGIQNLNVADCLVISTSAPIFVTLLAYFFLGEKCGIFPICMAVAALCGVFVMLGVSMALGSMLLLTAAYIIVRYLRNVNHALVNLGFAFWGFVQSIILASAIGVLEVPHNLGEIGLIIATALLAFSAQTCITLALKYEQAAAVALVRTSEVVFAFIWQMIFLAINPDLFSPEGYLYDKESILEYVITKKKEASRKLKEYEKQKKKEENEISQLVATEKSEQVAKFVKQESDITTTSSSSSSAGTSRAANSISNMAGGLDKQLPSYWIPTMTPQAAKTKLQKPDTTIYCPMSGMPLKMNKLIDVKFTEIKDPSDKRSTIVKDARYMCPITRDTLSNSVPCAVIRTTGHVVTMECVEKIIKPDWSDPLTGEKLTEKDIIPLQRGATGFSSTNINLEGKDKRPVLQV